MALVVKDRVRQTSTSTGTGTITLSGAVPGFQSFSVIGNANTTYYTIVDANTGSWEVGVGTYTSSGTLLSRDTVLESSNAGALVNFAAGIKDVFCTYPAEKSVYLDAVGDIIATGNVQSVNLFPLSDNTGVVGNASLTWGGGHFTNITVDSTISVRGAVDLADNDVLRLGSGDDWEFFHDGTNNYIDLNVGNLIVRDNTTTRFTFGRTTGELTATTFTGALNGNASTVTNGVYTVGDQTIGDVKTFTSNILSNVGIGSFVSALRSPVIGGTTSVGTSAQTLVRGRVADGYFGMSINNNQIMWNFITTANFDSSTNTTTQCLRTDTAGNVTAASTLRSGSGTAALPAFSTSGDTDTGIFFPAANEMAFGEGGTEVMRINASGNVGIGLTAPTQKLHVSGNILATGSIDCGTQFLGLSTDTATAPSFSFTGDTNTGMFRPGTDEVALTTGGTARLTVTTGQFTATLPWRGQAGTVAAPAFSTSGDTNTGIYFSAADTVAIATGGTDAATFDASGNTNIIGGIGVRAGAPSSNAAAVLSYTLGHGNTTRYGISNTLTLDTTTGNLTGDRTAYGIDSVLDTTVQNSLAFSQNSIGVRSLVRSGTAAGNSVDGEGIMRGVDATVQHRTANATFTRMETVEGVRSVVQSTGSTALIDNAFGMYSEVRPTNAGATINTGYLFYGTNSTVTGTFTNRWGVYIASGVNNYFAGGIQVGGTATGSTSAGGLGIGTTPPGAGDVGVSGTVTADTVNVTTGISSSGFIGASGAITTNTGVTSVGYIEAYGAVIAGTNFNGPAGTAALPTFTATADTNTGVYFPAADQVGISTGGTVRLTTTTAQFTATLPWRGQAGTAAAPALSSSGDTNTGIYFPAAADTIAISTAGADRVVVDASGNTSITTTSKVGRLTVGMDGVALAAQTVSANQSVQIGLYNSLSTKTAAIIGYGQSYVGGSVFAVGASGTAFIQEANAPLGIGTFGVAQPLLLGTNSLERARIDSAGNLLVGTTATFSTGSAYITSVANGNTSYGVNIKNTSATNTIFAVFTNSSNADAGRISQTGATTVAYTTSSDYRLKENVAPMTGALEKVAALKPCTYTWKADGSAGQGFIAHELQSVVPDCVTGTKDAVDKDGKPQYQGVDTSFLVATLVAAIQELKSEFDAYKLSHP
jgi:hypothetical protein